MKEPKNQKRGGETISLAALTKVRPVPFGDVRKYYLAAKVGTVVLLALCFHVSVAAIALRTDSCEQLSTALIVMMLLSAIAVIVGHYMRSLLGYGISAAAAFLLILLLQFGNGGAPVSLVSDLPEYGVVFRDGAKSTEFWILLAKVIAVVHLLLTVLFIRSTLTVTEEPPLKGMNVQIKRFTDWLDKNNNSLQPGRRPSDYWFVAAIIMSAMVFWACDLSMTRYDYQALILLACGCILVALKKPFTGSLLMFASALIRCTLYQFRMGFSGAVAAAYVGIFISLLYFAIETIRVKKESSDNLRTVNVTGNCLEWLSIAVFIAIIPIHEFLAVYSGNYMIIQKDELPVLFFLPIAAILLSRSRKWYSYLYMAGTYMWLWNSVNHSNPHPNQGFICFDDLEQHGSIAEETTRRVMALVNTVSVMTIVLASICIVYVVYLFILRGKKNETEE